MPDFLPPTQFTAQLEDKQQLNARFTQYFFELLEPTRMPFLAGQYASLAVNDQGERRSYSICSSPEKQHGFELLVDHRPAGVGCSFLENLKIGVQVNALGPLGRFVLPDTIERPQVFIANGSGIAPFRAMILELLQRRQTEFPVQLFWGMRQAEHLFWLEDWQELLDYFANFSFRPSLTQPPQGWTLDVGRVTDIFKQLEVSTQADYYLCGSSAMIQDMAALLKAAQVPEAQLHWEKFY